MASSTKVRGRNMPGPDECWLVSAEARRILRISSCDLAHLREEGVIRSEKRGNAYYYFREDVEAWRVKKQNKAIVTGQLHEKHNR